MVLVDNMLRLGELAFGFEEVVLILVDNLLGLGELAFCLDDLLLGGVSGMLYFVGFLDVDGVVETLLSGVSGMAGYNNKHGRLYDISHGSQWQEHSFTYTSNIYYLYCTCIKLWCSRTKTLTGLLRSLNCYYTFTALRKGIKTSKLIYSKIPDFNYCNVSVELLY